MKGEFLHVPETEKSLQEAISLDAQAAQPAQKIVTVVSEKNGVKLMSDGSKIVGKRVCDTYRHH